MPTTVRIGGMSRSALLALLREHGVRLNEAAEALFEDPRFTTPGRRRVVGIAALSVAELGFGDGARYGQLIARARESGLVECPLELGPHLRLQFPEQPAVADGLPSTRGRAPPGSLTITSPPLDEDEATPKGFYLRRVANVSWLRAYRSGSGHVWSPEDLLVFSKGIPARAAAGAEGRRASDGRAR